MRLISPHSPNAENQPRKIETLKITRLSTVNPQPVISRFQYQRTLLTRPGRLYCISVELRYPQCHLKAVVVFLLWPKLRQYHASVAEMSSTLVIETVVWRWRTTGWVRPMLVLLAKKEQLACHVVKRHRALMCLRRLTQQGTHYPPTKAPGEAAAALAVVCAKAW